MSHSFRLTALARRHLAAASILAALVLGAAAPLRAQTLVWDSTGVNAANPAGGIGTWSSIGLDWSNYFNLLSLLDGTISSTELAQFSGTAGTVTIGTGAAAQGLIFNTTGYILSGSNAITLSNGTIHAAAGVTAEIDAALSGTAGLIKSGAGTLTLGASASTYTGATTIRAGTLQVTAAVPASGNGALGASAAAISLGDASVSSIASVAAASTGNVVPVTAIGSTLTVLGLTSLDGVSLVSGTSLVLLKNQTTASQNGIYAYTYSTLLSTATLTRIDLTANGTYYGDRVTVSGGTTQAGTYYVSDQGSLTVNTSSLDFLPDVLNPSVSLLTAAAVTVARNINVVANGSAGTSTLGGATNASSTFSGAITLNRGLTLTSAATGSNMVTFSGAITDASGHNVVTTGGTGTVELTGNANTYGLAGSVGTIVSGGVLLADNSSSSASATGAGNVTLNAATLGGDGYISGAVTTAGLTSIIAPSVNFSTPRTLTLGSLNASAGTTLDFQLGSTANADKLVITGAFTGIASTGLIHLNITGLSGFGVGTYDLIDAGSLVNLPIADFSLSSAPGGYLESLSLNGDSLDLTVAAVPEPPVGGQLAAGLGLLWLISLRRWRKQSPIAIGRS